VRCEVRMAAVESDFAAKATHVLQARGNPTMDSAAG